MYLNAKPTKNDKKLASCQASDRSSRHSLGWLWRYRCNVSIRWCLTQVHAQCRAVPGAGIRLFENLAISGFLDWGSCVLPVRCALNAGKWN